MNQRPKVLLLIERSALVPYWMLGLERLNEAHVEPVLATVAHRGPLHDHAGSIGIEAVSLDVTSSLHYGRAVKRCRELIRDLGIDLVHACEAIPGAVGGLASRWAGVPVIFHRQHGIIEAAGPGPRAMAWAATRLADMTMAVSSAIADLSREQRPGHRICVAESGLPPFRAVDEEEVSAVRERLGIQRRDKVVVLVARLRAVKGHHDIIATWRDVKEAVPQRVHLVFVGDGPERDAISAAVQHRGLTEVHFVGDQSDVAPWFALADLALMPSRHEPFGLVAVEAMMSECPLVASRVGGLADVVLDGESGILVAPGDSEGFAAATVDLLRDPAGAARLARAGRTRYEQRYTAEQMVGRWLACYRQLLLATSNSRL